jgi:hypothetical protein
MKVIALSGWKQSGKDTLAAYLIEKRGAARVSFADPLKDMVAEEYGIDRASLDDPAQKERQILSLPVDPKDAYGRMISEFLFKEFRTVKGRQVTGFTYENEQFRGTTGQPFEHLQLFWTPRALAILKGSTNRAVRSDYWVQRAIKKIGAAQTLVVISDLRYKSELKQLKDAFGDDLSTVRVERFDTSPSSDPSERDLDDASFDYRVNNRGTREQAFEQLEFFIAQKTKKSPQENPAGS